MKKLAIIFLLLAVAAVSTTARDYKIILSPSAALSIDDPSLLGGSLHFGMKKGKHFIGAEYTICPQSKSEVEGEYNHSNVTERLFRGGGAFYLYDLYVTPQETFQLSLGGGLGYWFSSLNTYTEMSNSYVSGITTDQYLVKADMFFAPKLNINKNFTEVVGAFSSLTTPMGIDNHDSFAIGLLVDLGLSLTF